MVRGLTLNLASSFYLMLAELLARLVASTTFLYSSASGAMGLHPVSEVVAWLVLDSPSFRN